MNTTIRHRAHLGVAGAVRLPRELSIDGARREFDYEVAENAY